MAKRRENITACIRFFFKCLKSFSRKLAACGPNAPSCLSGHSSDLASNLFGTSPLISQSLYVQKALGRTTLSSKNLEQNIHQCIQLPNFSSEINFTFAFMTPISATNGETQCCRAPSVLHRTLLVLLFAIFQSQNHKFVGQHQLLTIAFPAVFHLLRRILVTYGFEF